MCCSVLQCIGIRHNACTLDGQSVAVRCKALRCVAVCCSVLQSDAVCCNVLQCIGIRHDTCTLRSSECCSVLQRVAVCCNVLQSDAVCCSMLQCVAECCNVSRYLYDEIIRVL